MHQQIRLLVPAKSPPNLGDVLQVVADAGINILAVGGSDHEDGGEFGFGVEHDDLPAAKKALEDARYRPRIVDVKLCLLDNQAGALLACVQEARAENQPSGKVIRDIAVGVPDKDGKIQVQIYSEKPRRP
jgi:hypothetical protein